MPVQKRFILAITAALLGLSSTGQALDEKRILPLDLISLNASNMLMTRPFIEVSSTENVYVRGGNTFPLSGTQCMFINIPEEEQVCFGKPTQIRLLPGEFKSIGLPPFGLSQIAYLSPVGSHLFPSLNGFDKGGITEMQQGVNRQQDILEEAKKRSLMFSLISNDSAEEDSADGERLWWHQESHSAETDMAQASFDDAILLAPGTCYCFCPDKSTEAVDYSRAATDGDSGSEGDTSSDQSNTNGDSDGDSGSEGDSSQQGGCTKKPHTCETCRKAFSHKGNLAGHRHIHSGEKPYPCDICRKAFSQKGNLERHRRSHSGEKPFKCETCGKAFTQSPHLATHRRSHSGEKPFKCETCGKAFTQSPHLERHRRSHSGEKPYTCATCGKAFADRSNLAKHRHSHSGEKPYTCATCGKAFADRSNLAKHRRTQHQDVQEPLAKKPNNAEQDDFSTLCGEPPASHQNSKNEQDQDQDDFSSLCGEPPASHQNSENEQDDVSSLYGEPPANSENEQDDFSSLCGEPPSTPHQEWE